MCLPEPQRGEGPIPNGLQPGTSLPERQGVVVMAYHCNGMLGLLRRSGNNLTHGCEVAEQATR